MRLSNATFKSSEPPPGDNRTGDLHVCIWPDIPKIELWVTKGRSCILTGGDVGLFVRWLTEEGFKL